VNPALPNPAAILAPLIDYLVADNPRRLSHINYGTGNWANAIAMFRAQIILNLRRIADEMASYRLPLSKGQALKELVSSEFFTQLVDVPTPAMGSVTMSRGRPTIVTAKVFLNGGVSLPIGSIASNVTAPVYQWVSLDEVTNPPGSTNAAFDCRFQCLTRGDIAIAPFDLRTIVTPVSGWTDVNNYVSGVVGSALSHGVIPEGTKFSRPASPSSIPIPVKAAEYVSTDPVIVAQGQSSVVVPIVATTTGLEGNIVIEEGQPTNQITLVDQLFDTTFAPTSSSAAGGGTFFGDDDIRRIAYAQPQGRLGPTAGAIAAGSLLGTGVRHIATWEDPILAESVAFLADGAWADASAWDLAILQTIIDQWQGFGGRTVIGTTKNIFVSVEADIQLRSADYLQDTGAISAACRVALQDYFDNRPDWYTWKTKSIQGALAQADSRILTCTAVTVKDRFGNVLSEPTTSRSDRVAHHFYLLSNGVVPSFSVPQ